MTPAPPSTNGPWAQRLQWAVDACVVGAAIWIFGLLFYTSAGRIWFPYDLEWMESGVMMHAIRVLEGKGIYVTPSSEFVPFIYPPLYHWAVAACAAVSTPALSVGRIISLVGTLVAAGAATAALRGAGLRWSLAIAGAAVYLSAYENTGAFFDLVRIDGLFMALLTTALVAGNRQWWRAAGILLTLAYATKHSGAAFGLPMLLWAYRTGGKPAAMQFVRWSVVPALAFTGAMFWEGDGLFLTYILRVPSAHGMNAQRLLWGSERELLQSLPFTNAALVATLFIALLRRKTEPGFLSENAKYWLTTGAMAIFFSILMRGHNGGFTNVLMPGIWALAVAGVHGLDHIPWRRWAPYLRAIAPLGVAVQLVYGGWDPSQFRATDADVAAGDALVERIRNEEGEILSPWNPWLTYKAGKTPYFHLIGLWDIDYEQGPLFEYTNAIEEDFAQQRWAGVVVMDLRQVPRGLKAHYQSHDALSPAGPVLKPKTGWRVHPRSMWRPKARAEP